MGQNKNNSILLFQGNWVHIKVDAYIKSLNTSQINKINMSLNVLENQNNITNEKTGRHTQNECRN